MGTRSNLALVLGGLVLLGCGSNNGDTGPEPALCHELSPDFCADRPDCQEVWGRPLGGMPGDWCADAEAIPELVGCELAGRATIGVIVYLAPVGDDENCYVFNAPWGHEGSWETCADGSLLAPCP